MINFILIEVLRATLSGIVLNRVSTSGAVTTTVAPDVRTLVGAHVVGNAIVNPRRTLGTVVGGINTVAGGVSAVANVISGNSPEVHEVQRSASSLMGEIDVNLVNLEGAVTTLNEVVNEQIRTSTTNQRNAIVVCTIAPIVIYFAYQFLCKPATQKALKEYLKTLPSPENVRLIVKEELEKRDSLSKGLVISLSVNHILLGIVGVILLRILYLSSINQKQNNKNDFKINKYS